MAAGLGAGAGLTAGVLASSAASREDGDDGDGARAVSAPGGTDPRRAAAVEAAGEHQAGIARPGTPQPHGMLVVLDLADVPAPGAADEAYRVGLRELCAALGRSIASLTSDDQAETSGLLDGPGDLTVTVGLGPRVVAALDPELPGAQALPAFAGDDALPADRTGGDLLIAVYGSDPNDVHQAARWLTGTVPGTSIRWSQRGFRAPGTGTVARNPLGFHDGVIVPHGDDELAEHVWIPDGPLAGGTVCVVRRLRLDTTAFAAESLEHQQAVIGRYRHDGSPLSGGGPSDEADLLAKTPDGQYVTPARSHVRAAHPSFTGSHLMLRRGYAFDDGATGGVADAGLLFICFQRDLRTFAQTQFRLDETDALSEYVTATGSGTFLILPGFDGARPLGATLP
ncbi:Dyp-type peroxidase [Jiangella asiatica]|uniref:Dyp-type peroxidase n=2 Tax=Jiangella asiatica TaxID=2530372 RepID=A0A4R5CQ34_9ACTN|nr:Dyp-type peroxidase [Jiangella asiatica]